MDIKQILSQVRALVSNAGGVEMSFGNPSKVNDLYVIPVAKIAFGFGGGGGSSPAKKKEKADDIAKNVDEVPQDAEGTVAPEANIGGGGGGGMHTFPIGIYTIKDDVVKFHPVISMKEIIALITVLSFFIMRLKKGKGKR